MIRTKRERCIREKGEEDFNFYYEKERTYKNCWNQLLKRF